MHLPEAKEARQRNIDDTAAAVQVRAFLAGMLVCVWACVRALFAVCIVCVCTYVCKGMYEDVSVCENVCGGMLRLWLLM